MDQGCASIWYCGRQRGLLETEVSQPSCFGLGRCLLWFGRNRQRLTCKLPIYQIWGDTARRTSAF
jgi:hypothetical protein